MNLAFLISSMTFHFYLNLGLSCKYFHYQDSNCDILQFFCSPTGTSYPARTLSKGSLATYFFNFNLFLTLFL